MQLSQRYYSSGFISENKSPVCMQIEALNLEFTDVFISSVLILRDYSHSQHFAVHMMHRARLELLSRRPSLCPTPAVPDGPRCPSTGTTAERSYRTLGMADSAAHGKADGAKHCSGTHIHRKSHPLTHAAHETCSFRHGHFLRSSLLAAG